MGKYSFDIQDQDSSSKVVEIDNVAGYDSTPNGDLDSGYKEAKNCKDDDTKKVEKTL